MQHAYVHQRRSAEAEHRASAGSWWYTGGGVEKSCLIRYQNQKRLNPSRICVDFCLGAENRHPPMWHSQKWRDPKFASSVALKSCGLPEIKIACIRDCSPAFISSPILEVGAFQVVIKPVFTIHGGRRKILKFCQIRMFWYTLYHRLPIASPQWSSQDFWYIHTFSYRGCISRSFVNWDIMQFYKACMSPHETLAATL